MDIQVYFMHKVLYTHDPKGSAKILLQNIQHKCVLT